MMKYQCNKKEKAFVKWNSTKSPHSYTEGKGTACLKQPNPSVQPSYTKKKLHTQKKISCRLKINKCMGMAND